MLSNQDLTAQASGKTDETDTGVRRSFNGESIAHDVDPSFVRLEDVAELAVSTHWP